MSSIIVLIIFIFGSFQTSKECTRAPFKQWTFIEGIYYVFNFIFSWAYYKNLSRTNRESTKFLLFNCFLNVLHTGWLIYGNVVFWPNYSQCGQEMI